MKDGAAILKIMSVQNFILLNKMTFYKERIYICEYEFKNISILFWNCLLFSNPACWAHIQRHLDLGPSTYWQVLKSAYLHKSCLKYPQCKYKMNCVEPLLIHCFDDFISNDVVVC